MFVESAVIVGPWSDTGAGVRLYVKNFGQTPAYRYTANFECDVFKVEESPRARLGPVKAQGSIVSGGSIRLNSTWWKSERGRRGRRPFRPLSLGGL